MKANRIIGKSQKYS